MISRIGHYSPIQLSTRVFLSEDERSSAAESESESKDRLMLEQ